MSDYVLLDTSAWVRYLRRGAPVLLLKQVREWIRMDEAATTDIVRLELLPAARTSAEFEELAATLDALYQMPLREDDWRSASANGFKLKRLGITVPPTDLIIATVALKHDAIVAHLDAHYEQMASHLKLRTHSLL